MSGLVVLDPGYGNVRSIVLAFERLGARPSVSADPKVTVRAERLVVPGVGAARTAMDRLEKIQIGEILRGRSKPTLGICLGMQLLFDYSEEDGGTKLLGILPGTVGAILPRPGFPVPHMGWSRLEAVEPGIGLERGDHVYFAHSFACPDGPATAARLTYGEEVIPAAIRHGPFWGAQFHPERSSTAGAAFLEAFLSS